MRPNSSKPPAFGLRIYRVLAGAFPYEFQCAYGDEMVQTAEDAIEEIWRRHGIWGIMQLLLDAALRLPVEYLDEFRHDVRYGLRALAAAPGFTAVALISLTLGIGVASSAFSEMNGFVLRNVPAVSQPDELAMLVEPVPYPTYEIFRRRSDLFSASFAYMAPVPFGVAFGGHTQRIWGHIVTPSYFPVLGVRPALGRFFSGREQPGQAPAVVVSYRFWQMQLGADPGVIGKELRINGQACTVIGVGPKEFLGASPMFFAADLWLPVWTDPRVASEMAGRVLERHEAAVFRFEGRLKPGVPLDRAEAELDTIARQIEISYGEEDKTRRGRHVEMFPAGRLMPARKQDVWFLTKYFSLLGGVILLIACANVANMTLARAADRRKEIAVRLAMGAGRARLVRQLLTESMLIAVAAGGLGFLLAMGLMRLASRMPMPWVTPIALRLEPDERCLLFTFALVILTGLAFGLLPALRATKCDLTPALKEGGALRFSRYRRLNLRNLLVVGQITASLTLLLIMGFLVIGYTRMNSMDVGFQPANLYLVSLDPVRDGFTGPQAAVLFDRILDRIERLPFVTAAGLTSHSPMEALGYPASAISTMDQPGGKRTIRVARRFLVGRHYFETVGVPVIAGRAFRKEDETKSPRPVILSEQLAEGLFPAGSPIGRRIELGVQAVPGFNLGESTGTPARLRAAEPFEVVGVAKNVSDGLGALRKQTYPAVYVPLSAADYAHPQLRGLTLIVRARPGVDALTAIRREIQTVDSRLTPYGARTMAEQIDNVMSAVRVAGTTYACLGLFGLILASVGLAGVTAYSVARRTREIGIRMALGARRADVLRLVISEGAVMVAIGTVFGAGGAWAGMRALSGVISQVASIAGSSASDPLLIFGAPALLATLAMFACYVPARKSMRIDPAVTLRQE